MVWKRQIEAGLRDALAARILAALTDMRGGLPPLEPGRGWQSAQALHQREDFRELVSCVHRGITSILINVHDPRRQASVIRLPVAELTADNTDQVVG